MTYREGLLQNALVHLARHLRQNPCPLRPDEFVLRVTREMLESLELMAMPEPPAQALCKTCGQHPEHMIHREICQGRRVEGTHTPIWMVAGHDAEVEQAAIKREELPHPAAVTHQVGEGFTYKVTGNADPSADEPAPEEGAEYRRLESQKYDPSPRGPHATAFPTTTCREGLLRNALATIIHEFRQNPCPLDPERFALQMSRQCLESLEAVLAPAAFVPNKKFECQGKSYEWVSTVPAMPEVWTKEPNVYADLREAAADVPADEPARINFREFL